jgi:hypothetical protein
MLTWQPPVDSGSPITQYTLRFQLITDSAPQVWVEQNTTSTSLTINDLLPGAKYLVGVAAQNRIGNGAFSESSTFTTDMPGTRGVHRYITHN